MIKFALFPVLALTAFSMPALAQDSGGVRLAPGINGGPVGLARPLPFVGQPFFTAQSVQNGMTAADHQAADQNAITKLRGDPGFLSGFSMGTPLAASRQQQVQGDGGFGFGSGHRHHHEEGPTIINNTGPLAVTVGNNNVLQQQSANGPGPIAQQQVVTVPHAGAGGAVNVVTGGGNIIQRAPGAN